MKASFESIKAPAHASFVARRFEEKAFSAPYHFHPEFELTLIVQGHGKRYVGAHMDDYTTGDLVLLGSNLPHCWKTTSSKTSKKSISTVIQFKKDFLGNDFFAAPEAKRLQQLFTNSGYGIQFTGNSNSIRQQIENLPQEEDGFKRLLQLLNILHQLAASKQYKLLHKQSAYPSLSFNEKERIHAAMAYIVENFRDNISLKKVAAITSMTPEAFCKYFKRLTRKTFIEVVNDYRIDFALGQLLNTEKAVAEIGYESGFNDISNFHKTFKERTQQSPLAYRKAFAK
ncbi:MAG: AraC family transcriptional regulator [Chitinophagaceae bacterium]